MRNRNFQKALDFVKEKHTGQTRAGNVPTWHHLARVSFLLHIILKKHKEATDKEREIIALAGLGHDILEDTDATRDEVLNVFGERGLELIFGMTNEFGDKNTSPYIQKVINADEGVRLIKLADLYDNITNVTYCISLLGVDWVYSFFLPTVTPMQENIVKTQFSVYLKTSKELIEMTQNSFLLLHNELGRYKKL